MISNRLLGKISVYIAILGTSGTTYVFFETQKRLKNLPFVIKSLHLLEDHRVAVDYLGKPLRIGTINLSHKSNFCDGCKAQFEVPVKGSRNSGKMYLQAERENPLHEWNVCHLEFSPASDTSKRLLVKEQQQ